MADSERNNNEWHSTRENDDTNHGDMTNETSEDELDKSTDSTHIITANLKDLTITSPTTSSAVHSQSVYPMTTNLNLNVQYVNG